MAPPSLRLRPSLSSRVSLALAGSLALPTMVMLACGGTPKPVPAPPVQPVAQPAPTVVPASAAPPDDSAPPLAGLERPAPLSHAALQAAARSLARDLGTVSKSPAVGDGGTLILERDRRRTFVPLSALYGLVFAREPARGKPGKRAQAWGRLFSRVPAAQLGSDGTLTVKFETIEKVSSSSLYLGTVMPDDIFSVPRFRKVTQAATRRGGTSHSMALSAWKLLKPQYDVQGTLTSGRGLLAWRVELLDDREGTSRVHDGSTPFRCDPAPCKQDSQFVQLPALTQTPVVDLVTATSAVVSFETDAATKAQVLVRDGAGKVTTFDGKTPGTRHEVTVTGLSPRTRYRYHVLVGDGRGEVTWSRGATFRTAPEPGTAAPVRFAVLSDSRSALGSSDDRYVATNRRVLGGLLGEALRHDPDFVLFVGDLIDGYTTEPAAFRFELDGWRRAAAPFGAYVPIYESMGNHEALVDLWESGWALGKTGPDSAEAVFASMFVNPENAPKAAAGAPPYRENVFSFDHGNVHIAVVNSNYWWRSHPDRGDHPGATRGELPGQREGWVNDALIAWLDADLTAARKAGQQHLYVCTHEPGFPNGGHVSDGMYWLGKAEVVAQRKKLFDVMAKHGVEVLFTGDEHNYSRTRVDKTLIPGLSRPVYQVISGGAGAPFYAQNREVPWVDAVKQFDLRQHLILVEVDGERAQARTLSIDGATMDEFSLPAPDLSAL